MFVSCIHIIFNKSKNRYGNCTRLSNDIIVPNGPEKQVPDFIRADKDEASLLRVAHLFFFYP